MMITMRKVMMIAMQKNKMFNRLFFSFLYSYSRYVCMYVDIDITKLNLTVHANMCTL